MFRLLKRKDGDNHNSDENLPIPQYVDIFKDGYQSLYHSYQIFKSNPAWNRMVFENYLNLLSRLKHTEEELSKHYYSIPLLKNIDKLRTLLDSTDFIDALVKSDYDKLVKAIKQAFKPERVNHVEILTELNILRYKYFIAQHAINTLQNFYANTPLSEYLEPISKSLILTKSSIPMRFGFAGKYDDLFLVNLTNPTDDLQPINLDSISHLILACHEIGIHSMMHMVFEEQDTDTEVGDRLINTNNFYNVLSESMAMILEMQLFAKIRPEDGRDTMLAAHKDRLKVFADLYSTKTLEQIKSHGRDIRYPLAATIIKDMDIESNPNLILKCFEFIHSKGGWQNLSQIYPGTPEFEDTLTELKQFLNS